MATYTYASVVLQLAYSSDEAIEDVRPERSLFLSSLVLYSLQ